MDETFAKPFTKAEMDAMRGLAGDEATIRRDFWSKLKRLGGRIPFAEDLVAAYYCATDPKTPNRVRLDSHGGDRVFHLPGGRGGGFSTCVGICR